MDVELGQSMYWEFHAACTGPTPVSRLSRHAIGRIDPGTHLNRSKTLQYFPVQFQLLGLRAVGEHEREIDIGRRSLRGDGADSVLRQGRIGIAGIVGEKLVSIGIMPVSYTHLRAHETGRNLVCRLLLE